MFKKIGCIGLILLVAVIWVIVYFSKQIGQEIDSGLDVIETKREIVGENVVLKGDTLMITDYTTYNNNYTLDDGREISYELAHKFLIKTE